MNTDELIKKILESTGYHNNQNVVLIMAYGSRITATFKEDSDLDILIITSKPGTYRQGLIIEGIPIDITIMGVGDAEEEILYSKAKGSTYFDSVLKNGVVILDRIDMYNNLNELLHYKLNRKRTIDGSLIERIEYEMFQFLNGSSDKNIHYFTALELMRKLYHAKCNSSNIQSSKVYDFYVDKRSAKEIYMLKLPDDNFINEYLMAMQVTDAQKQNEWLMHFYKKIENIAPVIGGDSFFDTSQIQIKFINLNNAIKKCKKMILQGHPNARPLFYIILGEIYFLYKVIYKEELQVNIDIFPDDIEGMMQALDKFFSILAGEHSIDYDDYKVRIN